MALPQRRKCHVKGCEKQARFGSKKNMCQSHARELESESIIQKYRSCVSDDCNTNAFVRFYPRNEARSFKDIRWCAKCAVSVGLKMDPCFIRFTTNDLYKTRANREEDSERHEDVVVRHLKEHGFSKGLKHDIWDSGHDLEGNHYPYRPDVRWTFKSDLHASSFVLQLEVDENQHLQCSYGNGADERRMKHLAISRMEMRNEARPSIFVRYNPDRFSVGGKEDKTWSQEKRLLLLMSTLEWTKCDDVVGIALSAWREQRKVVVIKLFYDTPLGAYERYPIRIILMDTNLHFEKLEAPPVLSFIASLQV
ncbi:hypothetical protein HJC23_007737 [Cyclotella cryptica]|uniref:Uncharacterized protein n=1 Tax=Cyclotella cryptica TaxID=29204 RepID=A0ABD3R2N1_9STRA